MIAAHGVAARYAMNGNQASNKATPEAIMKAEIRQQATDACVENGGIPVGSDNWKCYVINAIAKPPHIRTTTECKHIAIALFGNDAEQIDLETLLLNAYVARWY